MFEDILGPDPIPVNKQEVKKTPRPPKKNYDLKYFKGGSRKC